MSRAALFSYVFSGSFPPPPPPPDPSATRQAIGSHEVGVIQMRSRIMIHYSGSKMISRAPLDASASA